MKIMSLFRKPIQYQGQFLQDKWVIESVFKFKKKGYFVDLAAGNGFNFSNTYILEKNFRWNGICIEADEGLFRKLKTYRKCICENSCIDKVEQKVKYTKDKRYLGGIIDTDTDNRKEIDFIIKSTTTLEKILDKNNAPKIIDYLSLDVEGAETRIIESFPFKKYTFLAINVERPSEKAKEILNNEGYVCVGENACDKLYVHESIYNRK